MQISKNHSRSEPSLSPPSSLQSCLEPLRHSESCNEKLLIFPTIENLINERYRVISRDNPYVLLTILEPSPAEVPKPVISQLTSGNSFNVTPRRWYSLIDCCRSFSDQQRSGFLKWMVLVKFLKTFSSLSRNPSRSPTWRLGITPDF